MTYSRAGTAALTFIHRLDRRGAGRDAASRRIVVLVLPLSIPVLIFGVAASQAVITGLSLRAPFQSCARCRWSVLSLDRSQPRRACGMGWIEQPLSRKGGTGFFGQDHTQLDPDQLSQRAFMLIACCGCDH
jgi:CcmB protein